LNRLEPALFAGFLAVLVWAPLPFASNRPWATALLFVLLATLLFAWLLLYCAGRVAIDGAIWRQLRLPLLLLIAVQLWVLVQTLPLPRSVVAFLSPRAFEWHIAEGWLSLSLDPERTRFYLLRGGAVCMGFLLAGLLLNSHARVEMLLKTLVFSGLFQACYGSFMVLSGLELGFFVEKYVNIGLATGTFINRNHLAGYLVLCLSAGIGLLIAQLSKKNSRSWRDRLKSWLELALSPKMRLRFYLAMMVIALVLTRSRSGNIAFFTSVIVAGSLALLAARRFNLRMLVLLISLVLVDLALLGQWFGLDQVAGRMQASELALETRGQSNQATLEMIADFPLTGSGGGSFYGIFPNYQPQQLPGYHEHAHNDYLEFAAELGLPVLALLAAFVFLALLSAWRLQSQRHTPLYRGAGFAVTMAICWAAIHSATDFNLQIPANALTFATMLALAYVCRHLPSFSS
jgi:O-antigen ligase